LILNREKVGEDLGIKYGNSSRDLFLGGDCDDVVIEFAKELGWLKDLEKYSVEMAKTSALKLSKAIK